MAWWWPFGGLAAALVDDAEVAGSQPAPASHEPDWLGMRPVAGQRRSLGLSPERLAALLREAEEGDPVGQAELADELEDKDLHLLSVLGKRKRAVAGLPWRVVPATDRPTDRRIAAWCEELVHGIPGWRTALVDAMDAVSKGYAALEIDWRTRPSGLAVEGLLFRPARWFRPDRERPTVWRILDAEDMVNGVELRPGAWVWHTARPKSGSSEAVCALCRPLAWAYLFKRASVADLATFLETYNAPLRIGRYKSSTSEEDRRKLWSAVKALGLDAAAIVPDGVDIEFPESKNTSATADNYLRAAQWWDRQMSKAVLGETLTTEESSNGTQALGKVHNEVRRDLRDSDAEQLAETLSRDLLRTAVIYQFGPQRAYPRLRFQTTTQEDLERKAKLYADLGEKLGMAFPVGHVHEVFGIPAPKPGEDVYRGSPAAPPPGGAPRPVPQAERPHHVHALADLPPLSEESQRAISQALERGGYAAWEEVLAHLRRYLDQATRPEEVSALLVNALEQLDLDGWDTHLTDELVREDLIGRAQVRQGDLPVGEWPAVPPREAVAFWLAKTAMTPDAFATVGTTARSRAFSVSRFTTLQAVELIHEALTSALRDGGTLAEFEERYEQALRMEGLHEDSPWHIETVYRVNLGTAYNVGRYATQTEPVVLSDRPYWQYQAVDDSRTRPSHAEMDGRVWRADDRVWQAWYPPNGFGCRCSVRALSAAEVAALGLQVEAELPTTRRRRPDGSFGAPEPNTPDYGFGVNPAMEPHEFDFSRFPAEWRRALGVNQ